MKFADLFSKEIVLGIILLAVLYYAILVYQDYKGFPSIEAMTSGSGPAAVDAASSSNTLAPSDVSGSSSGSGSGSSGGGSSISSSSTMLSSDSIMAQDMLPAGQLYGTIGEPNKIPNYQIRSDPSIPVYNTGPWMQSTVQPDPYRRPFDLAPITDTELAQVN